MLLRADAEPATRNRSAEPIAIRTADPLRRNEIGYGAMNLLGGTSRTGQYPGRPRHRPVGPETLADPPNGPIERWSRRRRPAQALTGDGGLMQQLTGLDAAFLALDSSTAYGHVPLSAIADGQGLNLTVLGSNGELNFGALADRDLVPDVDVIIDALKDELAALTDAVAAG